MRRIYSIFIFSVILGLTACDITLPDKCQNKCPAGQKQTFNCSCFGPKKAQAVEIEQKDILQALAARNEQALKTAMAHVAPDSPLNLNLLPDATPVKRLYNDTDIINHLTYQPENLVLLSLLAPLNGFDETFALLLQNGADPNLQAFPGKTPLDLAISADQGAKVNMLLKAGAQANFEGQDEENILIRTLNAEKYNALYALASYAKEKQIPFQFPKDYFILAMVNNNIELANAVLPLTDNKVVNAPNTFGVLPLVQAALSGNFQLMDNLIQNGANLELRDRNQRTPVLTYLQEVYIAQIEGNFPKGKETQIAATVKHFYEKGADITAKDINGNNVMFYAVRGNNKPLIELLITNYQQDVNVKNNQEETPLFMAAQNAPSLVSYLLSKGANPRVMDANGRTPAIAAVEMGYIDIYDLLENAATKPI